VGRRSEADKRQMVLMLDLSLSYCRLFTKIRLYDLGDFHSVTRLSYAHWLTGCTGSHSMVKELKTRKTCVRNLSEEQEKQIR
jgi:hypothetical protein